MGVTNEIDRKMPQATELSSKNDPPFFLDSRLSNRLLIALLSYQLLQKLKLLERGSNNVYHGYP